MKAQIRCVGADISKMNTADDDDEVVPQLITLDEHLSEQIEARLKGGFEDRGVDAETAEDNSKKVPITILTGILCSWKQSQ